MKTIIERTKKRKYINKIILTTIFLFFLLNGTTALMLNEDIQYHNLQNITKTIIGINALTGILFGFLTLLHLYSKDYSIKEQEEITIKRGKKNGKPRTKNVPTRNNKTTKNTKWNTNNNSKSISRRNRRRNNKRKKNKNNDERWIN